jgi:hypothetical protein
LGWIKPAEASYYEQRICTAGAVNLGNFTAGPDFAVFGEMAPATGGLTMRATCYAEKTCGDDRRASGSPTFTSVLRVSTWDIGGTCGDISCPIAHENERLTTTRFPLRSWALLKNKELRGMRTPLEVEMSQFMSLVTPFESSGYTTPFRAASATRWLRGYGFFFS